MRVEEANKIIEEETLYLRSKIDKLQDRLDNAITMPKFDSEWLNDGFRLMYAYGNCMVMKKFKVTFKNYTINSICSKLPENLQYTITAYIGCSFYNDIGARWFLFNEDFKPYITFHSDSSGNICMGDMELKGKFDIAFLNECFMKVVNLLESVNPASWYNTRPSGNMGKVYDFVKEQWNTKQICRECENVMGECSCNDESDDWHCSHCGHYIGNEDDGYDDAETSTNEEGNTVCESCGEEL
jgi:hypothetical protein